MHVPIHCLPQYLSPLIPEMVVAGTVMTVLGKDVSNENEGSTTEPYGLLFDSLDALKEGEVYVCAGGTSECAVWGGLMTTRAMKLGATGVVIDGCYRDSKEILEVNFPTFGHFAFPADQKSRGLIIDYRCSISIGSVKIEDGDFIFGDMDGIVVIPKKLTDVVLENAFQKLQTENQIRNALMKGMSAKDAFEQFGIF